jgi:hypothetical protein
MDESKQDAGTGIDISGVFPASHGTSERERIRDEADILGAGAIINSVLKNVREWSAGGGWYPDGYALLFNDDLDALGLRFDPGRRFDLALPMVKKIIGEAERTGHAIERNVVDMYGKTSAFVIRRPPPGAPCTDADAMDKIAAKLNEQAEETRRRHDAAARQLEDDMKRMFTTREEEFKANQHTAIEQALLQIAASTREQTNMLKHSADEKIAEMKRQTEAADRHASAAELSAGAAKSSADGVTAASRDREKMSKIASKAVVFYTAAVIVAVVAIAGGMKKNGGDVRAAIFPAVFGILVAVLVMIACKAENRWEFVTHIWAEGGMLVSWIVTSIPLSGLACDWLRHRM